MTFLKVVLPNDECDVLKVDHSLLDDVIVILSHLVIAHFLKLFATLRQKLESKR
jgi:hypothetical protein